MIQNLDRTLQRILPKTKKIATDWDIKISNENLVCTSSYQVEDGSFQEVRITIFQHKKDVFRKLSNGQKHIIRKEGDYDYKVNFPNYRIGSGQTVEEIEELVFSSLFDAKILVNRYEVVNN